jgi:hypothetical protein
MNDINPYEDFEPIDPDADMSPADVDRHLKILRNELARARIGLRNARNHEIRCFRTYTDARNALLLSPECPEVSRSTGITVAERDAWINARIPEEFWAYEGAKVMRKNAESYSQQVREQVKCIQSIGANARQAYDIAGRG